MIIAAFVAAAAVGCFLGRLYSYVALLAVSPLLGFVATMAAWTSDSTGWRAALFGLLAMALSQAGFIAGIALDPGFKNAAARASRKRGVVKSHHPSASKR